MFAQRTNDALAVAHRRLTNERRALGNPNGAAALRRAAKGSKAVSRQCQWQRIGGLGNCARLSPMW